MPCQDCNIYIPDTKLIRYEINEHGLYFTNATLVCGTVDDSNNDMNGFRLYTGKNNCEKFYTNNVDQRLHK